MACLQSTFSCVVVKIKSSRFYVYLQKFMVRTRSENRFIKNINWTEIFRIRFLSSEKIIILKSNSQIPKHIEHVILSFRAILSGTDVRYTYVYSFRCLAHAPYSELCTSDSCALCLCVRPVVHVLMCVYMCVRLCTVKKSRGNKLSMSFRSFIVLDFDEWKIKV